MLTTSIYIEPSNIIKINWPYVQERMQGVGDEGVSTLLSS